MATYGQALPTITIPTRNGYKFEGYFSSTGGSGTKYYNADGTSATTWTQTSSTTLYTYWSIPPTTLTISGNGVRNYSWTTTAAADWVIEYKDPGYGWADSCGTLTLTAGGGGGKWVYSIISIVYTKYEDNGEVVWERDGTNDSNTKVTVSGSETTGAINVTIPACYLHSLYNSNKNVDWVYTFQAKSVINGSSITASFDLFPQ